MEAEWSTNEIVESLDVEKMNVLRKDVYHQIGVDIVIISDYWEESVEAFKLNPVVEKIDFLLEV